MTLSNISKVLNESQSINVMKDNDFVFSGPVCDLKLTTIDLTSTIESIIVCDDFSLDIILLSDF